jgi:hypothetical protein
MADEVDDWTPVGRSEPADDWQPVSRTTPAPLYETPETQIPQAFIDRLADGDRFRRALEKTIAPLRKAGGGFAEGFGSERLGLSEEHTQQLRQLTGNSLFLNTLFEQGAVPIDALLRTISGSVHAIGAIAKHHAEDVEQQFGVEIGGDKARQETINFLNYALMRGDIRTSRVEYPLQFEPRTIERPIGGLPNEADFEAARDLLPKSPTVKPEDAATAVNDNLRTQWQERGIHPAEALHDADRDAFKKTELTDPNQPIADLSGIPRPQGSPVPEGMPRSHLALTGDVVIDRLLMSEPTRRNIDNPVVVDRFDVPYSAAGSNPLSNREFYIDKDFPRSMTIDGVTIDPADFFTVHDNIEQHGMEILIDKYKWPVNKAYRVMHYGFAQVVEHAMYRAHGIDPEHAEAAYKPIIEAIQRKRNINPPPDMYEPEYPGGNPHRAANEKFSEPPPEPEWVEEAKRLIAQHLDEEAAGVPEPQARALGADVTGPLPSLTEQPASPPGSLVSTGRRAMDEFLELPRELQRMFNPMATGSKPAMVVAKDAISSVRRIRWDYVRKDADLVKKFDEETLARMWQAADEESVSLQLGEPPSAREHIGLATLTPEERAAVEALHADAQMAWLHMVDAGGVEGEGLPAYTPRMVLNVALAGEHVAPRALNELGRNVFTRTSQMLHRKYMTVEETEAAAKRLVEARMKERGATPEQIAEAVGKVEVARNIRALPLATARLEEAAIWRQMINQIEAHGKLTGQETVIVGGTQPAKGWITIAGNPAFSKWEPHKFILNEETGKFEPVRDQNGNIIMAPKPLWISPEYEGPLRAILRQGADANKVYGFLMEIKSRSMQLILNSPLIHNAVVWSKVVEAARGRELFGFGLYWRGNRIFSGAVPGRAQELIERGLNPMGPRGSFQDITALMEGVERQRPISFTAKILSFIPHLFDERFGAATEKAILKAGDVWHNTLLWNRVRDLHFGLADHLSDRIVAKGQDRLTADRIAAHFSNIIVGSIPIEAMSAGARITANLLMFSRSFTLGNLSTYKQAVMGLPKPILAQIERDHGFPAGEALPPEAAAELAKISKDARRIAARKAIGTIALSIGLYYIGNALIQHALNRFLRNATFDEEMQGYARRYKSLMEDVREDPTELRHILGRLSPTYENEPDHQDRVYIGEAADGTALYGRNPTGKFGEELVGYPTHPAKMILQKMAPLPSSILEVLENIQGIGKQPIYDENDTSIWNNIKTAAAVGKNMVMKELPSQQLEALGDTIRGEGDTKVNMLRLFGPVFGFSVSKGAPGGMARGEQLAEQREFNMKFALAWPDIKKQIQRGDVDGGRAALRALGAPNYMIRGLVRNAVNPAGAVHGRVLQNFYRRATPEQRERMERALTTPVR